MNASGILEVMPPSSSIEKGAAVALRVGRVRKLGAAWGAADETPSVMGSGTEPSAPSSVSDPGTAGSRITSAANGAPLATASATARASRANAARRRRISAPPSKLGRWRQPPELPERSVGAAHGRDLRLRSVRVANLYILHASRTLYMRCDRRRTAGAARCPNAARVVAGGTRHAACSESLRHQAQHGPREHLAGPRDRTELAIRARASRHVDAMRSTSATWTPTV